MKRLSRIRLVLALLAVAGAVLAFLWVLGSIPGMNQQETPAPPQGVNVPSPPPAAEEPADTSTIAGDTVRDLPLAPRPDVPSAPEPIFKLPDLPDTLLAQMALDSLRLAIPVSGLGPEDLSDTYTDARSEGRVHNAIDIMAPLGTPVVAATDGTIVKLFSSEKGGITIYQRGIDGRAIYYYAHLDRYAGTLAEGARVKRGEVIGYVGNTGNAGPENYHLHFAIWIPADTAHYWDGISINPYPILRRSPSAASPGATAGTGRATS